MLEVHVSDADLVMLLDNELDAERATRLTRHLERCVQCQARAAQFSDASQHFAALHASLGLSALTNAADQGSRVAEPAPVNSRHQRLAAWTMAAVACAASFVIAMMLWTNLSPKLGAATPDPNQTPGMTISTSAAEVCAMPSSTVNAIPAELAARVFRLYGIRDPRPRSYEVDYLITPALGGAVDVRNLWPQPYSNGVWNSHVKDALEDLLRKRVCSGRMELAEAQRELAHDWVSSYRRHFASDRPLAEHTRFVKDEPWQ